VLYRGTKWLNILLQHYVSWWFSQDVNNVITYVSSWYTFSIILFVFIHTFNVGGLWNHHGLTTAHEADTSSVKFDSNINPLSHVVLMLVKRLHNLARESLFGSCLFWSMCIFNIPMSSHIPKANHLSVFKCNVWKLQLNISKLQEATALPGTRGEIGVEFINNMITSMCRYLG